MVSIYCDTFAIYGDYALKMNSRRWKPIAAVLMLLWTVASWAESPEALLKAPAEPLRAGTSTVHSIYLHNTGSTTQVIRIPERAVCIFKSSGGSDEAEAYLTDSGPSGSLTIEAGKFRKIDYEVSVPGELTGTVRIRLPSFHTNEVMAEIEMPPVAAPPGKDRAAPHSPPPTLETLQTLYQPYIVNFAAYQPTYFLMGADPEKSKFQVSFKYRFISPESTLAENQPWVTGFHFAYTQTSFWDLASASQPFEDTSYKPEFFFTSQNIRTGIDWMPGLFVQTGFQHESNGRGGDDSRSTNFLYLKPMMILYDINSRFGLLLSPKVWAYIENDDSTNADLKDYRGYFDLEVKLGFAESLVLGSHLGWAKEGGSVQLDLTYPLHRILAGHLDLYLQVQYVNALAESLIDYRDRTEAFRIGMAIVR